MQEGGAAACAGTAAGTGAEGIGPSANMVLRLARFIATTTRRPGVAGTSWSRMPGNSTIEPGVGWCAVLPAKTSGAQPGSASR